jgi:isocitrate dehydrogenase (NAD+)
VVTKTLPELYTVTVMPGDGIGPEVTRAMQRCVDATGVHIGWDEQLFGAAAYEQTGNALPQKTLESIALNGVAIKGPSHVAPGANYRSVNVELRKHFNLYANVRPVKYVPGVATRITNPENIDLVIVRENVEDIYSGIEFGTNTADAHALREFLLERGHSLPASSAFAIKYFSTEGCERIARFAFEYAHKHERKKVTAIAKQNILPETDGLFVRTVERIAQQYPHIKFDAMIIDNAAQQSVLRPEQFDVIVTPNLYGDILSDLEAGLVGGIGVAAGANIGDDVAVFEAVHGTWPQAAGQKRANPSALILSGALMLRHLGETRAADMLEGAVRDVIAGGVDVTEDLNQANPVSTDTMTDAIVQRILQRHSEQ